MNLAEVARPIQIAQTASSGVNTSLDRHRRSQGRRKVVPPRARAQVGALGTARPSRGMCGEPTPGPTGPTPAQAAAAHSGQPNGRLVAEGTGSSAHGLPVTIRPRAGGPARWPRLQAAPRARAAKLTEGSRLQSGADAGPETRASSRSATGSRDHSSDSAESRRQSPTLSWARSASPASHGRRRARTVRPEEAEHPRNRHRADPSGPGPRFR